MQCVRELSLTHWKLKAEKAFWMVFKQNNVKTFKIEKLHLKCDHFLGSYLPERLSWLWFLWCYKGLILLKAVT